MFALFEKLPVELQIKIWKRAIPAPRLLMVGVNDGVHFRALNPVAPGLLGACKTSREEILKVYTTCMESNEVKIRLDGSNDTLVLLNIKDFDGRSSKKLPWTRGDKTKMHDSWLLTIKNLALNACAISTDPYSHFLWKERFRTWFVGQLQSLQNLILFCSWDIIEEFEGAGLVGCWLLEVEKNLHTYELTLSRHKEEHPEFSLPKVTYAVVVSGTERAEDALARNWCSVSKKSQN